MKTKIIALSILFVCTMSMAISAQYKYLSDYWQKMKMVQTWTIGYDISGDYGSNGSRYKFTALKKGNKYKFVIKTRNSDITYLYRGGEYVYINMSPDKEIFKVKGGLTLLKKHTPLEVFEWFESEYVYGKVGSKTTKYEYPCTAIYDTRLDACINEDTGIALHIEKNKNNRYYETTVDTVQRGWFAVKEKDFLLPEGYEIIDRTVPQE